MLLQRTEACLQRASKTSIKSTELYLLLVVSPSILFDYRGKPFRNAIRYK